MTPVKWKLYKILNYVLLTVASIIFLIICVLIFGGNVVEKDYTPYLIAIGFLIMVSQSILNLFVYSKHFPDKILSGKSLTIHLIALILNSIAFCGLSLLTIVGAIMEFGEYKNSEDQTGKLMLALCLFLWLIITFILFCQLTLIRYLKRNNKDLFTMMIESIGNKPEEWK